MSVDQPTPAEVETAADWIEDMDGWTTERREAFLAWLSERPSHMVAAQRIWALMSDTSLDKALAEHEAAIRPHPLPFAAMQSAESRTEQPMARPKRAGVAFAAAASIALAFGAWQVTRPGPEAVRFATALGTPQVERLEDGSTVRLDPQTSLSARLGSDSRSLALDKGRVVLQAAHDPSRPFSVHAGNVAATAIGTVFSVERLQDSVIVRVEEGTVDARGPSDIFRLKAGQGVSFPNGGGATRQLRFTPEPDAELKGEWYRVEGEPLAQVLARLQRRSATRFEAADEVAMLPVSGRFRLSDPEGSLRLIAESAGLRVEQADGRLTLTRR